MSGKAAIKDVVVQDFAPAVYARTADRPYLPDDVALLDAVCLDGSGRLGTFVNVITGARSAVANADPQPPDVDFDKPLVQDWDRGGKAAPSPQTPRYDARPFRELVQHFVVLIKRCFQANPSCSVYVVVFDKPQWVPPRAKDATRKKRAEAADSTIERHAFDRQPWWRPPPPRYEPDTPVPPMQLVMRDRALRESTVGQLAAAIIAEFSGETERQVIVDCSTGVFSAGRPRLPTQENRCGEADAATQYWAETVLAGRNVLLWSADTDYFSWSLLRASLTLWWTTGAPLKGRCGGGAAAPFDVVWTWGCARRAAQIYGMDDPLLAARECAAFILAYCGNDYVDRFTGVTIARFWTVALGFAEHRPPALLCPESPSLGINPHAYVELTKRAYHAAARADGAAHQDARHYTYADVVAASVRRARNRAGWQAPATPSELAPYFWRAWWSVLYAWHAPRSDPESIPPWGFWEGACGALPTMSNGQP
jgi:hypothetical protein